MIWSELFFEFALAQRVIARLETYLSFSLSFSSSCFNSFSCLSFTSIKVRIHGAILRTMAKLHRLSIAEIVARHIARNIAGVEFRPFSTTLRATNFICVSLICNISCNSVKQISVFKQSNLTFKFNRWPRCRPLHVLHKFKLNLEQRKKAMAWSAAEETTLIDYYRDKYFFFLSLTCGSESKTFCCCRIFLYIYITELIIHASIVSWFSSTLLFRKSSLTPTLES